MEYQIKISKKFNCMRCTKKFNKYSKTTLCFVYSVTLSGISTECKTQSIGSAFWDTMWVIFFLAVKIQTRFIKENSNEVYKGKLTDGGVIDKSSSRVHNKDVIIKVKL